MSREWTFRPSSRELIVVRVTRGDPGILADLWPPLARRAGRRATELYYRLPMRWAVDPPDKARVTIERPDLGGVAIIDEPVVIDEATAVELADALGDGRVGTGRISVRALLEPPRVTDKKKPATRPAQGRLAFPEAS